LLDEIYPMPWQWIDCVDSWPSFRVFRPTRYFKMATHVNSS
jgi:hypothetical protein